VANYIVVFEREVYERGLDGKEYSTIEPAYAYRQQKHTHRQRISGRRIRVGEWGFTRNKRRADRFESIEDARKALVGTRLYHCLVPDEDGKTLVRGSVQSGARTLYCPHRFTVHILRQTPHHLWPDRMITTTVEVWPKGKAIDALAALV